MRSSSTSRAERVAGRAPLLAASALIAAPFVALVVHVAWSTAPGLIAHLARTVLPTQLGYSVLVAVGAALGATALSAGGLLCAMFDFPGRRLLQSLMLVPLLFPSWFLAVLYRETWGVDATRGLIFVLAVSSAPLLHLLGSSAIAAIPGEYSDVLRLAGRTRPLPTARALLPLALPSLGAAAALVSMLAFADAACARTMTVPTLAVGVLDQWYGREDGSVGSLLGIVTAAASAAFAAVFWAKVSRVRWHDAPRVGSRPLGRVPMQGWRGVIPWLLGAPQLIAGVAIPAAVTGSWAAQKLDRVNLGFLGADIYRTLLSGGAGTLLAALLALPVVHALATRPSARAPAWVAGASFALFALSPAVLALSIFSMTSTASTTGPMAWLNATVLPLAVAWALRHAAVFVIAGQSVLARKARGQLDWMRLSGRAGLGSFLVLLRPVLARPLSVAAAFVFLEALKDAVLPLVLQPFGFDTISTRVFQYAQTQRVRDCAVWILCLVLIGIYPLFTLARAAHGDPQERGA
jgi:iron(III) transport system permease protein